MPSLEDVTQLQISSRGKRSCLIWVQKFSKDFSAEFMLTQTV